jgi:endoglucanase
LLRNAPKGPFPRQLSYGVGSNTLCVQLILNRYVQGAFVPIAQRSGAGVAVGPGGAWWRRFDVWTEDPLSASFAHGTTSARDPAPAAAVDVPERWTVTSADQPGWGTVRPVQVWRKSKIIDRALVNEFPELAEPVLRHRVYLRLPKGLSENDRYMVRFSHPAGSALSFVLTHLHQPSRTWTECVHVSQEGYHPDEPSKLFFVSQWLGASLQDGVPPYLLYDGKPFSVLDGRDRIVLSGTLEPDSTLADRFGTDATAENLVRAPSWKGNISALRVVGTGYRVLLADIGVSYSFAITRAKWRRLTAMTTRGATYFGCASRPKLEAYAGAEYTKPAHRPRGTRILKSQARCEFTSMNPALTGRLKLYPSHSDTFAYLRARATGIDIGGLVEGGWDDAADWDCRSMAFYLVTRLLTFYEMSRGYWNALSLETDDPKRLPGTIPDLLKEMHHLLDFFRLLQEAHNDTGGVPGAKGVPAGVEYGEHPQRTETSFANTLPIYSWAPDVYTSYLFAGAAAQWTYCVRLRDPRSPLVRRFTDAAVAAYAYAEGVSYTATRGAASATAAQVRAEPATRSWAAYAALHLHRLTGVAAYHADFLGRVAARDFICTVVYGSSLWPADRALNAAKRTELRGALAAFAERAASTRTGGFGIRSESLAKPAWANNTPGIPGEGGDILCYQHFLAPSAVMLKAIVEETLYGLGANPDNLCHITRCGIEWPYGITQTDYKLMGRNPTPGLVTFGMNRKGNNPPAGIGRILDKVWPHWPTSWPGTEEFTHWGNLAPTHEWGQEHLAFWPCVASYLAARLG